MIKEAGINFPKLADESFDDMLGDSTGAAAIFGATGGVMEAALRTVADVLTGKDLQEIEYHDVRGLTGVKDATVKIGDIEVRVAVAHSTGKATELLEKIKKGEAPQYTFIEVMGCPGGCVNGGGQPIVSSTVRAECNVPALRAAAIYDEDRNMPLRKSHDNPSIKKLYADFLGEPNGHLAHELLHTTYVDRSDIHV